MSDSERGRTPSSADPTTPSGLRARELAVTDDLTGAFNRRYLRRLFEREWPELLERHGRVALLLIDLDLFKEVNDRYGHAAGDVVLRAIAARLSESFRDEDRLVRWGGDEFVVVLPGAGPAEARALAERARAALSGEEWRDPLSGRPVEVPVSFSIGVASAPADGGSGDTVLAAADRRLYEEKRSRRPSAAGGRARRARWALALATLAVAALALPLAVSRQPSPEPPSPSAALLAARERARAEAARREREIANLSAELERLRAAGAQGPTLPERAAYEERIRLLEAALEAAQVAAARRGPAGPSEDSRGAEEAVAGEAPALPEPANFDREAASAPGPRPPRAAVVVAPQLIAYDSPLYPPAARARGLGAEIDFRVRVDARGRVVFLEPLGDRRGYGFDEAARVAALSARYRPGMRDGAAEEMETTLRIVFRMEGEGGS